MMESKIQIFYQQSDQGVITLVDKILEISDSHVVGVKSVTMNEPFFEGHFPGAPVMPGVLIVEAYGQAAAALTAHGIDP